MDAGSSRSTRRCRKRRSAARGATTVRGQESRSIWTLLIASPSRLASARVTPRSLSLRQSSEQCPILEQARFAQDGRTATGPVVRAVRVARYDRAVSKITDNLQDGEVSEMVRGYAPLACSTSIKPLNEKWRAYVQGIPEMHAAREKKACEDAEQWCRGDHPSQQIPVGAKRLLNAISITHNGCILKLPAGRVVSDPALIGSLTSYGAELGGLDEAPRARPCCQARSASLKSTPSRAGPAASCSITRARSSTASIAPSSI